MLDESRVQQGDDNDADETRDHASEYEYDRNNVNQSRLVSRPPSFTHYEEGGYESDMNKNKSEPNRPLTSILYSC